MFENCKLKNLIKHFEASKLVKGKNSRNEIERYEIGAVV